MKCYAAYYNDSEIRIKSSSGGIFSLFASNFDIVYGIALSEDCYEAKMVRLVGDIESLRGSKYMEAKIGDAFKLVKKDLIEGKEVLFTGTGCQINGLNMFLGKVYNNLLTIDVVCHGTPSPKLWKEYVKYNEKKYGKFEIVSFRCKDESWQNFGMKENNRFISKDKDSFMRMFLRNYCLRPSCYECHAKRFKTSDITIADFWGIDKVAPEMNDGKGTSLIIVRSNKGQIIFNKHKNEMIFKEVSYEDSVKENSAEYSSVEKPSERNHFFNDLSSLSFEEMEKKYAADIKISLLKKIIRKTKYILKI